jgi:hypothetical protein
VPFIHVKSRVNPERIAVNDDGVFAPGGAGSVHNRHGQSGTGSQQHHAHSQSVAGGVTVLCDEKLLRLLVELEVLLDWLELDKLLPPLDCDEELADEALDALDALLAED